MCLPLITFFIRTRKYWISFLNVSMQPTHSPKHWKNLTRSKFIPWAGLFSGVSTSGDDFKIAYTRDDIISLWKVYVEDARDEGFEKGQNWGPHSLAFYFLAACAVIGGIGLCLFCTWNSHLYSLPLIHIWLTVSLIANGLASSKAFSKSRNTTTKVAVQIVLESLAVLCALPLVNPWKCSWGVSSFHRGQLITILSVAMLRQLRREMGRYWFWSGNCHFFPALGKSGSLPGLNWLNVFLSPLKEKRTSELLGLVPLYMHVGTVSLPSIQLAGCCCLFSQRVPVPVTSQFPDWPEWMLQKV